MMWLFYLYKITLVSLTTHYCLLLPGVLCLLNKIVIVVLISYLKISCLRCNARWYCIVSGYTKGNEQVLVNMTSGLLISCLRWNVRWCCIVSGCTQGIPQPAFQFLRSPAWTECRGSPQPPGLRLPTQLAQNRPIKPLLLLSLMTEVDAHSIPALSGRVIHSKGSSYKNNKLFSQILVPKTL